MFVPYSKIPLSSKIWIYQSDRELSLMEVDEIKNSVYVFCQSWTTHGQPIYASYKVNNWFICLFVNEEKTTISGCSIDKSIQLIKYFSDTYSIDFFNRTNILLKIKETTKLVPLSELKQNISSYTNVMIYNNLVKTKAEFEKQMIQSIEESWLNRYFK